MHSLPLKDCSRWRRSFGWRSLAAFFTALVAAPPSAATLAIVGETALHGVFDPSVAVDPTSGDAWLAYSAVFGAADPWGPQVETHVARSSDGGASWTFAGVALASVAAQLTIGGEVVDGFWNREVPSLAYDPAAAASQRWKLVTHNIFRRATSPFTTDQNEPIYSWLEVHEAASPTGPWQRVARLGAGPTPPTGFPVDQLLNAQSGLLSGTLLYSEPGLIVADGRLYLSLSAIQAADPFHAHVVLFSSADGGVPWEFEGELLLPADATALGYLDFDGTALVTEAGRIFLLASPQTSAAKRDGVSIFEVTALASATLAGRPGTPTELAHVALDPAPGSARFGGQAGFHEQAAAGGIVMNQVDTTATDQFQVVATGVTPVPEPSGRSAVVATILALRWVRSRRAAARANDARAVRSALRLPGRPR